MPDGDAGDLRARRPRSRARSRSSASRAPTVSRRAASSPSSPTGSTRRWTARPSRRSATRPRVRASPSTPSPSRPPTSAVRCSTSARSPSAPTAPSAGRARPTICARRSTTLTDELNKQYVLTYKIDARSLEGKTFQLASEELVSNALTYDSSGGSFGYAPATRSPWKDIPWWLWGLMGIVLFGGAAAVLIARGRPKKAMKFSPYKTGGAQPAPVVPGPEPRPQPRPAAAGPTPSAPSAPRRQHARRRAARSSSSRARSPGSAST